MSQENRSWSSKRLERPNPFTQHTFPACTKPANAPSSQHTQTYLSALQALEFLHRGERAVVTFHRKSAEEWQDLGGISALQLPEQLPTALRHLESDSYFSINSTYIQRHVKASEITGLPLYSRRATSLRCLNALPVDLDAGHDGETFCLACLYQSLYLEVEICGLPIPSLIVSSGRGIWGLWRIADHIDRNTPVKAFPEKQQLYRRIERELVQRFKHLGADSSVVDPARVMRIPETLNTKGARLVQFWRDSNACHTLNEVATILGVANRQARAVADPRRAKDSAKVRAARERWRRPLKGFEQLSRMRRYFVPGDRHKAVYVYALLLRKNGNPEDRIGVLCRKLGASCKPPLDERDVKRCVTSSTRASAIYERSISNNAIARMLHMTPEERAALPEWFKDQQEKRKSSVAARFSLVKKELELAGAFVADRSCWMPTRGMSRILLEKHGIKISHVAVARYYRELYSRYFTGTASQSQLADSGKLRGS